MKYLLINFAGYFLWGGIFFVSALFLGSRIVDLEPLVGTIPLILILGCLSVGFFAFLSVSRLHRWMQFKTLSGYYFLFIPCLAFIVGLGLAVSGLFFVELLALMGLHR